MPLKVQSIAFSTIFLYRDRILSAGLLLVPSPPWGQSHLQGGLEDALLNEVRLQRSVDVQLLVWLEHKQLLQYLAGIRAPYETGDVHVHKSCHQILTVKSVHDSAMPRDGVCKILDFESSFETTGKEASKWANQRSES